MKTVTQGSTGIALITAKITMRGGREMWMCNPYSLLAEALVEGKPFEAHMIESMEPKQIMINPAHVATIERKL